MYRLISLVLLYFSTQTINCQNFEKHVFVLSSDSLKGREAGSDGELKAATYIKQSLEKQFTLNTQEFNFLNPKNEVVNSKNVIAIHNSENESDSSIILVAHYDHIGTGIYKSKEILSQKRNQIHNGADDNASGVAMVMELGNHFVKKKEISYNIILLFTSAHELGLYGADFFVKNFDWKKNKVKAVINFDMIGRLDPNNKILGVSCENDFIKQITKNAEKFGIHISKEDFIDRTDLKSFIGYSNLLTNFSTGTHDDYHRIADDADKINYQGMNELFEFFKKIISDI